MPFTGGSPSTRDQLFLDGIDQKLSGQASTFSDPSAVSNSWMTMELFSATIVTATTTTGPVINVKNSSSQTLLIDITGQLASGTAAATGATGLVLTLRAGLSGFGFITLRAETAGLGQFAWKVAQAGTTTGATANTTGVTRYDDMFLQINNPTTATGGSVVVKARVFTSPEF